MSPRADGQPRAEVLRAHIAVEGPHQEDVEPPPFSMSDRLHLHTRAQSQREREKETETEGEGEGETSEKRSSTDTCRQ